MAFLVTLQGPDAGKRFALEGECVSIGRQPDSLIYLDSLAVSRHHAQVVQDNEDFFIEDVGSSNGTFVNGQKVPRRSRVPISEEDRVQIGPYVLALRRSPTLTDTNTVIRARVEANAANQTLFSQNSTYKLQMVLEIAQHLGHTLDLDVLLAQLLDHLLQLFPQADRGMVLLCKEGSGGPADEPILRVHTQKTRNPGGPQDFPFSRSIVRKALEEGVGLLSEDVADDSKITSSQTFITLNLRSFLCVPLVGKGGKRWGVIQLDSLRSGAKFKQEDLEVLTAVSLHVAVVLENASLHAEQLRQARLQQELLVAREIQQSFLPDNIDALEKGRGIELFARVHPAREVSGDLYDIFPLADGRLLFYLGDVSGKGMPAALFMIAVRTLARHLAAGVSGPADLLTRLHNALIADNPTSLFVTLACGIYDPETHQAVLSLAGHPAVLLRTAAGDIGPIEMKPTTMLGNSYLTPRPAETTVELAREDTLICYSDGMTEALAPDGMTQYGIERLCQSLSGNRLDLSLEACARAACADVQRFTGKDELQDDQTLLFLRRR